MTLQHIDWSSEIWNIQNHDCSACSSVQSNQPQTSIVNKRGLEGEQRPRTPRIDLSLAWSRVQWRDARLAHTCCHVAGTPDGYLFIRRAVCVCCVSGTPDGYLFVYDAKFGHGKPLHYQPDAHDLGVTCCAFSPSFSSGTSGGGSESTCSRAAHSRGITVSLMMAVRFCSMTQLHRDPREHYKIHVFAFSRLN